MSLTMLLQIFNTFQRKKNLIVFLEGYVEVGQGRASPPQLPEVNHNLWGSFLCSVITVICGAQPALHVICWPLIISDIEHHFIYFLAIQASLLF